MRGAVREVLDRLDPGSYVLDLSADPAVATALREAGHRVATDDRAGPFDAALAFGEVLNVPGLDARLARLRAVLPPGGMLVFDLAGPGGAGPTTVDERHDRVVLTRTREEGDELVRRTTTFSFVEGASWRRSDRTDRLHLHAPDAVLAALAARGFSAFELTALGGERLPPGRTAFVAD